jgi:polyhydroxybutyrate depolymerase
MLVPNGTNPENGDTYGDDQGWNDLRPDQASGQTQVDDVGFLLALLDKTSSELPVDQERIYVTGASNGGMMTYRMLLEAPERFAAGAAYIAKLPDFEDSLPFPSQPVPIMIANGTEDPLMPYEGGVVAKNRGVVISTRETVDWWVQANGADPQGLEIIDCPDMDPQDGCQIREEIYPPGSGGAEVRLYIINGGGHTLPSVYRQGFFQRLISRLLGPVCQEADGVLLAWDFFSEVSTGDSP